MEVPKFVEKSIEKTPGLGYVVGLVIVVPYAIAAVKSLPDFVVALLLGHGVLDSLRSFAVNGGAVHERVSWLTIPLVITCILLYWAGSPWDDYLFDPLYSTPSADSNAGAGGLKKRMQGWTQRLFYPIKPVTNWCFPSVHSIILDRKRRLANRRLRLHARESVPIYKRAKQMLIGSEDWEKKVHGWLEISKTSRTFILPFLIVLVCALLVRYLPIAGPLEKRFPAAKTWLDGMKSWWFVGGCAVAVVALTELYVVLRIRHMIRMYELIETKAFWFSITSESGEPKRMLCCVERPIRRPSW